MHEVIKNCGTIRVTDVLLDSVGKIGLTKERHQEVNLRLTMLLVILRDHPMIDIQFAFAQAATMDTKKVMKATAGAGG